DQIAELGIRNNVAFFCAVTTGHISISLLRTLRAIVRAALLAILHALRVEHAAQDVVTNARKVAHAATTNEHDRVLLQVVTFTWNIGDHFALVGEANLGNLAQSRVRLLRGRRVHTRAYAALLRVGFHGRNLVPLWLAGAWFADQLINGGHCALSIVQNYSVNTSKPKRRSPDPFKDSAAPQLQRTTRFRAAVMRTRICFV